MMLNGNESLGFVETTSLVAAIEASDAMAKAAYVRLETTHKPGGGRVCVFVHGDLASCQAAVAAGAEAAKRCGTFLQSHVLARPDAHSEALWMEHIPAMRRRKQERTLGGVAHGTDGPDHMPRPDNMDTPDSPDMTDSTDAPSATDTMNGKGTPDAASGSDTADVSRDTDAVSMQVAPKPRRAKKQRKPE